MAAISSSNVTSHLELLRADTDTHDEMRPIWVTLMPVFQVYVMYFSVASECNCRCVQIRLLLEGRSFCLVMFISSYAFETKSTHKRVNPLLTKAVYILVGCWLVSWLVSMSQWGLRLK